MNTIKTIILTVVVTAIGYGAYLVITQEPPVPPEDIGQEWAEAPTMELNGASQTSGFTPMSGSPAVGGAPAPATSAPPFVAAPTSDAPPYSAGGEAPPFAAPATTAGAPATSPSASAPLAAPPAWAATPQPGVAPPAEPALAAASPDAFGAAPPAVATSPFPDPAAAPATPTSPASTGPSFGGDPSGLAPTQPPASYSPTTEAPAAPGFGAAPAPTDSFPAPAAPGASMTAPGASAAPTSFTAALASVQSKLDASQYVEAHRELSQWYERPELTEPERKQLLELLDALTGTVIYSRDFHAEPAYEVQPGDDLERVAQQYNVPWQFLQRINGVEDPHQLAPGQKLKVVRGPFRATVDLEAGQLTVWLDDRYAGRFPIGRNAPGATPEGEYAVQTKIENPAFYGQDGTVEADAPGNPLGERWIELSEQVGIHGAADVNAPGHPDTAHCIRMSATDVEDLYDILSLGSKITVRR